MAETDAEAEAEAEAERSEERGKGRARGRDRGRENKERGGRSQNSHVEKNIFTDKYREINDK